MNSPQSPFILSTLTLVATLGWGMPSLAQVAGGSTTLGVSVIESTQLAMGWSVKKTLLGKTIYNDTGDKVGTVEDLIVSPDKNVSYVIVGTGGFVGIGMHDVAVPTAQIQNRSGRLVLAGATKASIKALPSFDYANDTSGRATFIAAAEKDISLGHKKLSDLEKTASTVPPDVKAKLDAQFTALQGDVKTAESKLSELKRAEDSRWKEFSADVSAATARVRKAL